MPLKLAGVVPLGFEALPESPVTIEFGDDGYVGNVSPAPARRGRIRYVSPGWVDLHAHVYLGGASLAVPPARAGLARGVHVVVDAGTAGEANLEGLRVVAAAARPTEVYSFINISSVGLVNTAVSEFAEPGHLNPEATLRAIARAGGFVRGVKVRASRTILGAWGLAPVKAAKACAERAGLPLMVHVGEIPPCLGEVLDCLGPGDLLTHCFHGKGFGLLDPAGAPLRQVEAARDRGVLFDVGHGAASFSYEVAAQAIQAGFAPDTISTDLHVRSAARLVGDLALTMSKLLWAGLTLTEAVRAVTVVPRRILRLPRAELRVGALADLTVFSLEPSAEAYPDAAGGCQRLEQVIQPCFTVRGGRRLPVVPVAEPTG